MITEFDAFFNAKKSENANGTDYSNMFGAQNGEKGAGYYGVESYFMNLIGAQKNSDKEDISDAWKDSLQKYTAEEAEKGWETWQKVLLGVGIAAGVLIVVAAVTIPLAICAKKKKEKAAEEAEIVSAGRRKPVIDTTDDKSIDVYADDEPAGEAVETAEVAEESAGETAVEAETAEENAESPESVENAKDVENTDETGGKEE